MIVIAIMPVPVLPFPAMSPVRVSITVHAIPSPLIVLLSPASRAALVVVVEILLWIYPAVMFRERVARINARLTMVVHAVTILGVTGSGHTGGQGREQDTG